MMRGVTALFLLVFSSGTFASGMDIVSKFKAAGLEAEDARPMKKKDYGMAPYVCKGTRFYTPIALGEDAGGRIFVCKTESEAKKIESFYVGLGEQTAWLASWVFRKGKIVVQINGDMEDDLAESYNEVLSK